MKNPYNNGMDIYASVAAQAKPVSIEPSETSYFSVPVAGLDPRLFRDSKLIPSVRSSILRILFEHLKDHYYSPEAYIHVWLAGSGVSYQWTAARSPADLDCLIGVNYLLFRQANQQYRGLSDQQIADMFNEDFSTALHQLTKNFMDVYELTFFVNVKSDIRSIKPYAAYSVTNDDWTVQPELKAPPKNKAWEYRVSKDVSKTEEILSRYSAALNTLGSATTDTARRNAEAALKLAVEQGAALFDEIHHGRRYAFSPSGQGYMDVYNYRWQAGKAAGSIQALRKLKDVAVQGRKSFEESTYGMVLPDPSVLVRRALSTKR
jgi:AraC-like DNA-binding protein